MKTAFTILTTTLLACLPPGHLEASESPANSEVRHKVVWVTGPGAGGDLAGVRELVEESGANFVHEASAEQPSAAICLETLLAHRALAVAWHGRDGSLNVLFVGEGEPQLMSAQAGTPQEEGLFVRELIVARLRADDQVVSDVLTTVPGEYIETTPTLAVPSPAPKLPEPRTRKGWKFGAGYNARVHMDEVTWVQHTVEFILPAWRFGDAWVARAIIAIGLPSIIGDRSGEWMEVRTIESLFSLGAIPMRSKLLEAEMGAGIGFINTSATAFLIDGTSESTAHLSGQSKAWVGVLLYLTERIAIRIYGNGSYVFSAPSYSINGNGDFAGFPWRFGGGIDVEVSVFDQ